MGRTQLSPGLRAGFSLSFLAFSTPASTGWPPSSLLACYSSTCFGEDTEAPLARAGHGHPNLSRGTVGPVLGSSIRKLDMDKDPAQSGLEGLRSLSNDPSPSRGLGWPQVENISLPAHLCRETEQRLSQVLLPSAKSPEGCLPPPTPCGGREDGEGQQGCSDLLRNGELGAPPRLRASGLGEKECLWVPIPAYPRVGQGCGGRGTLACAPFRTPPCYSL